MVVYVDDFKIAAREHDHDAIWKAIGSVIDMEPEVEDERFLGCKVTSFKATAADVKTLLEQHPSKHRRPHLTKEDCNGDFPNWTYDQYYAHQH